MIFQHWKVTDPAFSVSFFRESTNSRRKGCWIFEFTLFHHNFNLEKED